MAELVQAAPIPSTTVRGWRRTWRSFAQNRMALAGLVVLGLTMLARALVAR